MQFIASAQGYTATPETSLDCSTTLDINAGDVLVAFAVGNIAPAHIDSIAEDDASNSFDAVYAVTASWHSVGSGYKISASASTGATFKVTLSEMPNGGFGFIVLHFRPDSGETVSFGSAPASANSGWGANPTSAALSTTSTDSLFVGCATNDRSALSNIRIAGVAVDGSVAHATLYATAGYTVFDSAQTNITYQTASSDGVWGAQMICLDIAPSFEITGSHTLSGLIQSGTLNYTPPQFVLTGSHSLSGLIQSGSLQNYTPHHTILLHRGLKATIPVAATGEPLWTLDTHELYIGTSTGNAQIADKVYVDAHINNLSNPHQVTLQQATDQGNTTDNQIISTVTTGTAPFTVTSSTGVVNLNADLWDGYQFSDYLNQAVKTTSSPSFIGLTVSELTAERILYTSTGGVFAIDSDLTFDGTTLTATTISNTTLTTSNLAVQSRDVLRYIWLNS